MNTSLSEATSLSAMPASSASRGLCPSGSARPMSLTALDQEQEPDGTGRETMAMIEAGQDVLILKRASASRSSGQWSDDDFDVVAVGRIFKAAAAPIGSPWLWTLAYGHHEDRTPTHGYAATRESAMRAFAKAGGGE